VTVSVVICGAAEAIRYVHSVYKGFTLFYTYFSRFRYKLVHEVHEVS